MQRYEWPGNVRELQHAVERAVIMTAGSVLSAPSFETIRLAVGARRTPLSGLTALAAEARSEGAGAVLLKTLNIDEAEAMLIERALKATGGNKTKAAELLGLTDRTLRNKLARQREATGEKS
jgi:DNA-binding NtrC family response regulator